MGKEGVPLQYDLFSGDLVDNRTQTQRLNDRQREQPQQTEMFLQREIAQFGVHAHPQLSLSPHTKLVLISEDPRTEEEIEAGRLKEAQRLTTALFAEDRPIADPPALLDKPAPAQPTVEADTTDEDEAEIEESLPPVEPPLSKYAAYRQLVAVAEEQAATISASSAVMISERISLSVAQFAAKRAGLNETEIATAITIGEFRGRASQNPVLPAQPVRLNIPEPVEAPGWEAQPARENEPIELKADEPEIPILWLYRSDLVKRRPDLTEKIQSLGDYEIEALAALVGEALEEFYWIQLNVVLSLYLDHELHLRLQVPAQQRTTQPG